jgi:hypothetical protein
VRFVMLPSGAITVDVSGCAHASARPGKQSQLLGSM